MNTLSSYVVVSGLAVASYVAASGICLAEGNSPQAAPQPSTQNVNVVNTPTVNSKELDNPARQPVQHSVSFTIAPGTTLVWESTPAYPAAYTVPLNKRLVIDTVSAMVTVHTGETAAAWVAAGDASIGQTEVYLFPSLGPYMSRGASASGPWDAMGTTKVQAYADAGSTVKCYGRRWPDSTVAGGTVQVACMWSGHLVDVP